LKEYDPGMGKSTLVSFIVAIVVVTGVLSAAFILPNLPTESITTTTGTNHDTTRTTPPNGSRIIGPLAANYLTSRRDDVEFYWIYNCSFVNENLSHYYQQRQEDDSIFVDGVKMWRNATSAFAQVLFSPYHENIIGFGEISLTDWNALAGSIIDDGIRQMSDATSHPADFPATWPIDLLFEVFFNDNTFFEIGFTKGDGKVHIRNATWSGEFTEWGHPDIIGFQSGYWLDEGGYFRTPMLNLFDTITTNVDYPET
jgi:hypothetical protein